MVYKNITWFDRWLVPKTHKLIHQKVSLETGLETRFWKQVGNQVLAAGWKPAEKPDITYLVPIRQTKLNVLSATSHSDVQCIESLWTIRHYVMRPMKLCLIFPTHVGFLRDARILNLNFISFIFFILLFVYLKNDTKTGNSQLKLSLSLNMSDIHEENWTLKYFADQSSRALSSYYYDQLVWYLFAPFAT